MLPPQPIPQSDRWTITRTALKVRKANRREQSQLRDKTRYTR